MMRCTFRQLVCAVMNSRVPGKHYQLRRFVVSRQMVLLLFHSLLLLFLLILLTTTGITIITIATITTTTITEGLVDVVVVGDIIPEDMDPHPHQAGIITGEGVGGVAGDAAVTAGRAGRDPANFF